MEEKHKVVIDNGSGCIKAGFAGNPFPSAIFPSIVRRLSIPKFMLQLYAKDVYVGDECYHMPRTIPAAKYPIERGIITNWDDMEKIWSHTFRNELRVYPEECCVLLTEQPSNLGANREKTTQIMFETFNTPFLYLSLTCELTAFAHGRISGMVIESGYGVSHTVPVIRGHAIKRGMLRMEVAAGRDSTEFFNKILSERGYALCTSNEALIDDIKRKLCYVSQDYKTELEKPNFKVENYELPDGRIIAIGDERFRCSEPLFQPSLIGSSAAGIQELLHNSITKCDVEIHNNLFANMILSGGNTLFPGMGERIQREIFRVAPAKTYVSVLSDPERMYSNWKGGAVLASMDQFKRMCISKEEYDEYGPSIVNRKCF